MADISSTSVQAGEPFWSRVRLALEALRPGRVDGALAYGPAAIARSIGIKPRLGIRIEEELAQGWQSATARRVSMSVLIIEIDGFAGFLSAYGRAEADDCLLGVMQVIRDALPRREDTCLRLGNAGFVVAMPDMPVLIARSVASKIGDKVRAHGLPHRGSHAGVVTVSQGLAVTNPVGDYQRSFFETVTEALKRAQRKGLGRIEAVDLRPGLLLQGAA